MSLFIAIAGNIGVGKSTLTERLTQALGGTAFFEPVHENPYLADFYQDMGRWAFHSQMFYLARRLEEQAAIVKSQGILIQDRTLYENAEIFARHLFQQGHIHERDWSIYDSVYQTASKLLQPPDLVIYLQASVPQLVERIKQRGRAYEQQLDPAYLAQLNQLYDSWAANFTRAPLLTINTDAVDYVGNAEQFEVILNLIKEKLGGLPTPLL